MTPPSPRPPAIRIELSFRTLLLVLGTVAAIWLALSLHNVLVVILVALIMVGTLEPVVAWFEMRGMSRGKALALVFTFLTLAFTGLVILTIPPLVSQLVEITAKAPQIQTDLVAWLSEIKGAEALVGAVKTFPVEDLTAQVAGYLLGYSTVAVTMFGYALTILFLVIYLLADPVGSKSLVFALVPRRNHVKLAKILLELKVIVGGYMRGQLITSAAIIVFVFVLLTILRVENALAIAIFAGVTDVIPFVGGLIASAPVILAAATIPLDAAIVVAVIMFIYQEFESRLLVPRVYGRVLRLSPAVVLVALLVGGTLMGILGALLALPVAAGIRMMVHELRVELPGAARADAAIAAQDERTKEIYEQLTEGATAADAAVIATDLARGLKTAESADGEK